MRACYAGGVGEGGGGPGAQERGVRGRMCVAPGPYRATQGRGWGYFGDAGLIFGPGAGSFRLPAGQHVLGGELLHASPGW